MSMIGAQINELRELATRYDELQVGAVKAVTMPSDIGSILRDAADTIWQLRDDLQRANAAVQDAEHDESMAWDRVRKVERENEKLRELVVRMFHTIKWSDQMSDSMYWPSLSYERELQKLGLEVDA